VALSNGEVSDVRIGHQIAGRDIRNYEISAERMDADLQRRLDELERALQDATRSGSLDDAAAAEFELAAREVVAAAADPTPRPSRVLRAVEVLKNFSAATASTVGVAEAVDKMIHLVTGM
jgi:hypothetical protein